VPVPRICANGYGYWHTPTANDSHGIADGQKLLARLATDHEIDLAHQVRIPALWPTPTADDASGRRAPYAWGYAPLNLAVRVQWPTPTATLGDKGGVVTPAKARENGNLVEALAAHLWPTPTANDAEKRGNFDVTNPRNGLPGAVRWYPTPMTTDADSASPGRYRRASPQLCCYADGGPLNPAWVEWLMGWPIGWTDLAPLDPAQFDAWRSASGPQTAGVADPWFGIDPATQDAQAPGFVPRMAPAKVPHRARRIEALGNGQVPRVVVQAWAALRDREAANEDACEADTPQDAPRFATWAQS